MSDDNLKGFADAQKGNMSNDSAKTILRQWMAMIWQVGGPYHYEYFFDSGSR